MNKIKGIVTLGTQRQQAKDLFFISLGIFMYA